MRIIDDEHYEELYRDYLLDLAQIGDVSTDKWSIRLPYSGELPWGYDRAEISFIVRPDYTRLVLHIYCGEHGHDAFTVQAEREEIDEVLWKFFFREREPNVFHTRFDNGLTRYWAGYLQAEYVAWKEYTDSPTRIADIARQLTAEQRKILIGNLQQMGA